MCSPRHCVFLYSNKTGQNKVVVVLYKKVTLLKHFFSNHLGNKKNRLLKRKKS